MHATNNNLSEQAQDQIVELLNQVLADLISLQLHSKQALWNSKGRNFITLHEFFSNVAADAWDVVDRVAERITALGGQVEATTNLLVSGTRLSSYRVEIVVGNDLVDAFSCSMEVVAEAIRDAIDQAAVLDDADTVDLLANVSQELEKKLWFIESHLYGNA